MKRYLILIFLILAFSGFLNITACYAAVTNSVVYKLSVTIPAHVMPTSITASESESSANSKKYDISSQESDQQTTVIESTQRDQETITLRTVTLK